MCAKLNLALIMRQQIARRSDNYRYVTSPMKPSSW